jgi:hypothetical protein
MKFLENILSTETVTKLKDLLGTDLLGKVEEATKDFKIDVASEKFIPKAKFDEVNNQVKDLRQQITDREKQIKELGQLKDNGELTKKIAELEAANKKALEEYDAKLKARDKEIAIDTYLMSQKARNVKAVKAVLDLEKVTHKDGKLEGLEEMVTKLKESDGYLFDVDESNNRSGGDPNKKTPPTTDKFARFRNLR